MSIDDGSGILPTSQQARISMLPDDLPPRVPAQRREVRSYSPGGSSRPREAFHVRRIAGAADAQRRGVRRQARIVKFHHEVWIGVLLLVVVLVVAGGLWMAGRDRQVAVAAQAREDALEGTTGREAWQGPIPYQVAENFTAATTHAERLKWVRNPEKVGPLMERFFRDGPGASEKVVETVPLYSSGDSDLLYENYQVVLEDGRLRKLSVSVDPRGAKVDFKSYARHGSESWDDLLSGAVGSADEMRVELTAGGFYMHRFPDETRWLHLKATTPDLPQSMDFYVERDSEAARELARIEDRVVQVTVSVRAVEDSAAYRQFEITALKASGWMEPGE